MTYKTILPIQDGDPIPVVVAVKSWYERPATWLAVLTTLVGIVGVISQNYPQWASIGATIAGVLQLITQGIENVISTQ